MWAIKIKARQKFFLGANLQERFLSIASNAVIYCSERQHYYYIPELTAVISVLVEPWNVLPEALFMFPAKSATRLWIQIV